MRSQRGPSHPHGFTLVEILVALTIFAIGAVTVFVVFPASSMALRQAKEYSEIGLVLDAQLNAVLATPFNELSSRTLTENLPSFVEKVDTLVTSDPLLSDLKQVEIKVTYKSKGKSRTNSVTTNVFNQ